MSGLLSVIILSRFTSKKNKTLGDPGLGISNELYRFKLNLKKNLPVKYNLENLLQAVTEIVEQ